MRDFLVHKAKKLIGPSELVCVFDSVSCDCERTFRFVHVNEDVLMPLIKDIHTKFLKTLLLAGIAFYHSRLTEKEKKVIKMLFDAGAIQVRLGVHMQLVLPVSSTFISVPSIASGKVAASCLFN